MATIQDQLFTITIKNPGFLVFQLIVKKILRGFLCDDFKHFFEMSTFLLKFGEQSATQKL